MEIINLTCPHCGANLQIEELNRLTKCFCQYCGHAILLADDSISAQGTMKVEGLSTDEDILSSAESLLSIHDYLSALEKFKQYAVKCPQDYRGWLGLLRARTRDFSVADHNALFKLDVNKYNSNFQNLAPDDVKMQYEQTITEYFHPEIKEARLKAIADKEKQAELNKQAELKQRMKELKQQAKGNKGGLFSKFKK